MMLAAFRKKVVDHERISRANQGRNQFNLREKMVMTLPLVALVVTLFTASFKYTAYKSLQLKEAQAKEAQEPQQHEEGSNLFRDYIFGTEDEKNEGEFLNDDGKKW